MKNNLVGVKSPLAEVYLHVSNSGARFKVEDTDNGIKFSIRTSAFGNLNQTTEITTNLAGLIKLRDMLNDAIDNTEDKINENYSTAYPTK